MTRSSQLEDPPPTASREEGRAPDENGGRGLLRILDRRRLPRTASRQRRVKFGGAIPEGHTAEAAAARDTRFRRLLAAADALATGTALAVAVTLAGDDRIDPLVVAAIPGTVLIAKCFGLYDRDQHVLKKTTLDEVPVLFQASTLFAFGIWLGQPAFVEGHLSRGQVVMLWVLLLVLLPSARQAARRLATGLTPPERCLLVGDAASARRLRSTLDRSFTLKATLVGRIPLDDSVDPESGRGGRITSVSELGTVDTLGLVIAQHEVDRVVIAPGSSESEEILNVMRLVKAMGVKVSVLPRLLEVVGSSVEFDDADGVTLLGVRRYGLTRSSEVLKRGMDIAVSSAVLLLMSPLLLAIAVAIKLTSPGPVLFRQLRIGRHEAPFQMLKFRTMFDGADDAKASLADRNECDGLFKISDDPRITSVGKLLRRTCLDELPQLLNVLRGQMSLVGPRPLVADEDSRIMGWERGRLRVAPGMTGFWQILGSSRVPLHEMVKIDYLYGANWSLWLDVKILLRTIPFVLSRRGL